MELRPGLEELEDAKAGILQLAWQGGVKENIAHNLKLIDFMWQKPHAISMTGLIEQSQEALSCPNHCLDKQVKIDVVLAQLISQEAKQDITVPPLPHQMHMFASAQAQLAFASKQLLGNLVQPLSKF